MLQIKVQGDICDKDQISEDKCKKLFSISIYETNRMDNFLYD